MPAPRPRRVPVAFRRRPGAAAAPRVTCATGQATVELVALLPLLAVGLAACWQLALAGHAAWSAAAGARAAARAHAVGSDVAAAAHAAAGAPRGLTVDATAGSSRVVVHVRIPAVVPGLDLGSASASATFATQR